MCGRKYISTGGKKQKVCGCDRAEKDLCALPQQYVLKEIFMAFSPYLCVN